MNSFAVASQERSASEALVTASSILQPVGLFRILPKALKGLKVGDEATVTDGIVIKEGATDGG